MQWKEPLNECTQVLLRRRRQRSVTRLPYRWARALGGESVKWDRDVCSLPGGLRRRRAGITADSNVTFSIRKSRFVCITSFVAPEMRWQPRSLTWSRCSISKRKSFQWCTRLAFTSHRRHGAASLWLHQMREREEKVAKLEGIRDGGRNCVGAAQILFQFCYRKPFEQRALEETLICLLSKVWCWWHFHSSVWKI